MTKFRKLNRPTDHRMSMLRYLSANVHCQECKLIIFNASPCCQAILALKKGANILKCDGRGKPKFCPFRLSTDEKTLIWFSDQDEQQLQLNLVTNIVCGQKSPYATENGPYDYTRSGNPTRDMLERELKAITDREVCCFMISCKNSTNIDSVIDWLIKHSKSKN